MTSPDLAKLEKQLREARKERDQAAAAADRARLKQAAAWDRASQAQHPVPADKPANQPERDLPRFTPTGKDKAGQAATIQRDGALARQALAAHARGERLPHGKDLDRAIKRGDLKPVKDSEGRVFFQNKKTGAVLSKDLNRPPKRETTSANVDHLGLTSTKYKVVDRKVLGLKVGTTILKSGSTLRTEAAGKLRDGLHKATGNSKTAKILTRPLNAGLKKGEAWRRASAREGLAARAQMNIEQKLAEREDRKALDTQVKAADAAAARDRNPDRAATKAGEHSAHAEIRKDIDRGVQMPADTAKLADIAKDLERRTLDRAPATEHGCSQEKATPAAEQSQNLSAIARDLAARDVPDPRPAAEKSADKVSSHGMER